MKRTDEAELLAWLDGELTPERRAEIQQQLETDWELRTALAQLERRIGKYVEATAHQSPAEIEPFNDFWQRLSPQLDALTASQTSSVRSATSNAVIARLVNAIQPRRYGLRLAIFATVPLLVVSGLILYLSLSTRVRHVSAEELLQRSIRGEELRLNQLSEPVVYRKLQVKRLGASQPVVWETWNDAKRKQFHQRVADNLLHTDKKQPPAVIVELEQILRANRFDPQRALSAAAFAEWRNSIKPKAEEVVAGDDELKLTTTAQEPYAVNAIAEATLVVRKSDWHAVALLLKVQGEQEIHFYELSEAAYDVLPLQALMVFADLAPTPAVTIAPTVAPNVAPVIAAASPAPTVALPGNAALQAAEVAALYALHQAQADLGEQIEIIREAHGVSVRGLVETEARKQQLAEALRDIPLVTTRLQTIVEAARQAAQKPAAAAPVNESVTAVTPDPPKANAFEQRLTKYFAELDSADRRAVDLEVAQLSNEVISESSAALSEAWALRRLLERYPAASELSPAATQRIDEMSANHIARLQAQSRKLRARLEPVMRAIAGERAVAPQANSSAEATKQAQALALFRAVETAQQLTHRLFGGAGSSSPEEAARQLLAALARMEQSLRQFEQ